MLWDGGLLQPRWEPAALAGVELYDHRADDGRSFDGDFEAVNLALDGQVEGR
jgi:hypothetical protein